MSEAPPGHEHDPGTELPPAFWRRVYWVTVIYGVLTILGLWWLTRAFAT